MKYIKRVLAITLATVLAICICGCGKQEKKNDTKVESKISSEKSSSNTESQNITSGAIDSKDAFVKYFEKLIDLKKYGDVSETVNNSYKNISCILKSENKVEYDMDNTVTLGDGTEIKMPCKVSELEKSGWKVPDKYAQEKLKANSLLMTFSVVNSANKELSIGIANKTDNELLYKDTDLVKVEIIEYSQFEDYKKETVRAQPFTVCGDLTEKSTISEVIKKLGNPTSVFVTCHYEYDDNTKYKYSEVKLSFDQKGFAGNTLVFSFFADEDYIVEMEYGIDVHKQLN